VFFEKLESRQMFAVTLPNSTLALLKTPPQLPTIVPAAPAKPVSQAIGADAAASGAIGNVGITREPAVISEAIVARIRVSETQVNELKTSAAKAGGQLQNLLGSATPITTGAANQLDSLRNMGGESDRLNSLLGKPQIVGSRNSKVSTDPAEEKTGNKSLKETISDGANTIYDFVVGKFGPPGGGEATTLLRGPGIVQQVTGDAKDLFNGFKAIFQSGDKDPRMPDANGNVKTPLPPGMESGSSGFITAADLKGALGRVNFNRQPTGEENGTGGPVNTGATGTGRLDSQAQFVEPRSTTITITHRDIQAIEIRTGSTKIG
jgi:hypothetical protein